EDGIRDFHVTGVQTCALPILVIRGGKSSGWTTRTLRVAANSAAGGLFDADGTAIVIHASPDDEMTDPSGNSGARIACGVIERRRSEERRVGKEGRGARAAEP